MKQENTAPLASDVRRKILPLLCLCSFGTLFSFRAISPILVDISQEFGITVAATGSLGAAYSLPAVLLALFFGPISDRYGRRPLILMGQGILILSSIGSMLAPSFIFLFLCRILAGLGAAAVSPSISAAIGDYFPYSERGRAYGWLISSTTMAIVVGVPAGSILAGSFSWRWMFGLLTLVFLAVMILMIFHLPAERRTEPSPDIGFATVLSGFKQIFRVRSAAAALLSTIFFGIFWYGWGTYNGAFFIQTLGISTEDLAPIFTLQGLAILSASQIGGLLSDRFTKKSLAVTAMIAGGVVMALLTHFGNTYWLAITLNTLMSIPTGLRFVSGSALLSELTPTARATFLSFNASAQEMGSMMGASLGGLVLGSFAGYGLLGISFAMAAFLAALILHFFVVEAGLLKATEDVLNEGRG